ncbi:hypothetical protein J6P92_05880 [bacterium]|nr:hypothetical protein [bacterium]
MKKYLLILSILLIANSVYAISDEAKSRITAKRQVYSAQKSALNSQLDKIQAEYTSIAEDATINSYQKQYRLRELESQILQINLEKNRLKTQYEQDKKDIKKRY